MFILFLQCMMLRICSLHFCNKKNITLITYNNIQFIYVKTYFCEDNYNNEMLKETLGGICLIKTLKTKLVITNHWLQKEIRLDLRWQEL